MTRNERIVENVNASMSMEGMSLTSEEKEVGLKCLNGELDFREVIGDLVKKYTNANAKVKA
jgi:hypothetical protein